MQIYVTTVVTFKLYYLLPPVELSRVSISADSHQNDLLKNSYQCSELINLLVTCQNQDKTRQSFLGLVIKSLSSVISPTSSANGPRKQSSYLI